MLSIIVPCLNEAQGIADSLVALAPLRARGAEVIVVLFHDTLDEAKALFEKHPELAVHAVVAGQNHRKGVVQVGEIPIMNPGPFGRSYGRFDLEIDRIATGGSWVVSATLFVYGQ